MTDVQALSQLYGFPQYVIQGLFDKGYSAKEIEYLFAGGLNANT